MMDYIGELALLLGLILYYASEVMDSCIEVSIICLRYLSPYSLLYCINPLVILLLLSCRIVSLTSS